MQTHPRPLKPLRQPKQKKPRRGDKYATRTNLKPRPQDLPGNHS